MTDGAVMNRRLERERLARKEAERLLEEKSRELYEMQKELMDAAESIQESWARQNAIMSNVAEAIITQECDGTIDSFNKAAETIFGYSSSEVVGQLFGRLLPAPSDHNHDPKFHAAIHGGCGPKLEPMPYETLAVRRGGELFPIQVMLRQFSLGSRTLIITTVRDISARKARMEEKELLESQLRQSQKMDSLGTLAGGIAHEFNNMLVPMLGLTELVIEDLEDGSLERDNLEKVLEAGHRAKGLVSQILSFTRDQKAELTQIDLNSITADAMDLLRTTIPATIELRRKCDDAPSVVLADATELHQIVMNLVSNASDAIDGKNGVIELEVSKIRLKETKIARIHNLTAETYAVLSIKDSGPGMDQETRERIFEPFFTTKAVGAGTGMGLAVVHTIVKRAGGAIDVVSEPGEGTEFKIYIPLVETLPEAGIGPSDTKETAGGAITANGSEEGDLLAKYRNLAAENGPATAA